MNVGSQLGKIASAVNRDTVGLAASRLKGAITGESPFKQIANEIKNAGSDKNKLQAAFKKFNGIPAQTLFRNSTKAEARTDLLKICDAFEQHGKNFDDADLKTETYGHLDKAMSSALHETGAALLKDSVLGFFAGLDFSLVTGFTEAFENGWSGSMFTESFDQATENVGKLRSENINANIKMENHFEKQHIDFVSNPGN